MLFGLMVAGLTMSATAPAQTVRPIYREIGDWLLACDNVRDCVARQALAPESRAAEDDPDAGMDIVRKAGPAGTLTVRVTTGRRLDPASIAVPGRPAVSVLPWRRSADGEDASLSAEPARRFVRTIADAPVLRLGATRLSLKGLAAVLLAMDEAQGRLGNVTALMRPGSRPASATPAAALPPLVPVGAAAPPLAKPKELAAAVRRLNARTLATHDCDMEPGVADEAYPLTPSDAIVLLGCGRFAYQTSVLAFRTARDRPQQAVVLKLPEPRAAAGMATPGGASTMDEYVEGSYDPVTRVFAEYSKGRGLADCGSSTEWTFDGRAFRLSALRWQDRCAGAWPGEWPILYRTRRAPVR
jgi:hypothetical protein